MTLRTHLDGRIFAEHLTGQSPAVLALHGWQRDRSDLLPALRGREVIALDLPGFGASPEPPGAWGAAGYAGAVAEAVKGMDRGPLVVVGHSFGGRVAIHLAADHPDLVSGLVLAGVPLWRVTTSHRPPLAYQMVRTARRFHLVPEATLDTMRRRYGSADYRAVTGVMRDVLVRVVNEDYRPQLGRIRCPVGFCWGAEDTAASPDLARQAADLVARPVALDIVEGVNHDVHRGAPDRLGDVLDLVVKEIA
jgi:pimeloyl-ACP methyl ester carboxylesterase